jgi:hypothetical protein
MRSLCLGLACAVSLAGCQEHDAEPDTSEPVAVESTGDWLETLRATPLESEFASNDEYAIQAIFPASNPVCNADSGGHIHGFYQRLDQDYCSDRAVSSRFISLWADYNAAFRSWEEAQQGICGPETEPFDIGIAANGAGQFLACKPMVCGEAYVITAGYLADFPDGTEPFVEDGPYFLYTISLGTTEETEAADLVLFREFFANLRLAGSRFSVES